MSNLTILNTSIRTRDSLYSLNDLHSLSGSEDRHQPNRFIRLDSTQELITEMVNEKMNSKSGVQKNSGSTDLIFKTLRGRNIQGTYACKELVIAYAAWISPAFHLVVLRAFLNQIEPPKQLALPEPDYRIDHISQSEEALALFIRMYSFCFQAHEMQEKLRGTNIPKQMENEIGGQYLYNFKYPLEQTMAKAKQFIQSNTERLALVKAFHQLLD